MKRIDIEVKGFMYVYNRGVDKRNIFEDKQDLY